MAHDIQAVAVLQLDANLVDVHAADLSDSLGVACILTVALDVTSGLIVWPKVIESHVKEQLPFMATENILMECVKAGGDRQELHEAIRVHSMEAARVFKQEGKPFDLLEVGD